MNSLKRLFGFSNTNLVLFFIIGILGFCLFHTQPVSAYSPPNKYYYIYSRGGYRIYYNGSAFTRIDWAPQISLSKNPSTCSGFTGPDNYNSSHDYTNCIGMTVQENSGASNLWYEQAYYSYEIEDFDHTETISVGGGYIYDWGGSMNTVNSSHQFARSDSGATSSNCDSPNWNGENKCSVLILFNPSYSGDFSITLDNDANSASHEYGYKGPKTSTYYHLTFAPNGGSVTDSPSDEATLVSYMSGANLIREYAPSANANEYPVPTWAGHTFAGWYTAASGGSRVTSRTMNSDETLYAHWINWNVTPTVSVNSAITHPGSTATWTHTVVNNGPDNTDVPVYYNYINGDSFPTPYASGSVTTISAGWQTGFANRRSKTSSYTFPTPSADGGKDFCRATQVWPGSAGGGALRTSSCARTHVPYNYRLTPTLGLSDNAVDPGGTINVTGLTITNRYPTRQTWNTQSKNTNYTLTKVVIAKGAPNPSFYPSPPSNGPPATNGTRPCPSPGYFTGTGVTCSTIASRSGSRVINANSQIDLSNTASLTNYSDSSTVYAVGTRICYSLSVQRYQVDEDVDNANWSHSGLVCAVVGKRPKFQIHGSDLKSGNRIVTSTSTTASGSSFGSWVEYAIFSRGTITNIGSAAAFSPSTGWSSTHTKLSFANTSNTACTPSLVGCYYSSQPSIPDIAAALPGAFGSADVTLTGPSSTTSTQIIKTTGTVTIRGGDITYPNGPYASISNIPQLIIIATHINIENSVRNLDAWLIATNSSGTGTINTCSNVLPVTAALTESVCNNKLKVNGPVIADKIYLRRTAGSASSATLGDPAEVFNLRADAYLWAINRSTATNKIRTTQVVGLPPRY